MNLTKELETLFDIPEGHTPKVLLAGQTDNEQFVEDKGVHTVLALLVMGKDHVHALFTVPALERDGEIDIDESLLKTNDLKRITDWLAGMLSAQCLRGTVGALDIVTEQTIIGEDIKELVKGVRPPVDLRLESIGSVDDILSGQLGKKEIDQMLKPKSPEDLLAQTKDMIKEVDEQLKRIPVKEEDPNALLKKQQQEVVDKYGWKALETMAKKMKQPILVEKPYA